MKTLTAAKLLATIGLVVTVAMFSGCIRRTSDPVPEETEFIADKITLSNAVGAVNVTGNANRIIHSRVQVEKRVQTYSLFGLANPDNYLDRVEVYQGVKQGELHIAVSVKPLPFLERLFVKVSPRVQFDLATPVAMTTDVALDVGDVSINNLVGEVTAKVDVGEMAVDSTLGIFGSQSYTVNIGSLDMQLPKDMPLRYDLETSMGSIDHSGFDMDVERRFLGARATGAMGMTVTPSFVKGRVNIGSINFRGK